MRLLREALALWRGAGHAGRRLADSAAFDAAVTRLEGLRLTAMEDRFDAELSLGHGAELVAELTDLVAAHPLRERLAGALMRALWRPGGTPRRCSSTSARGRPWPTRWASTRRRSCPRCTSRCCAASAARREENRKTNLRAELTSFVGRDADVAAVGELVAEHRLTTLIGPGGSGKTRLATRNRTHAARRPARRGLAGGARRHRRRRRRGAGDARRRSGSGTRCSARPPSAEPADRLIAAIARPGGAADPGQLRARDRGGGGARRPAARGVPAAADPGDQPGTARHHR